MPTSRRISPREILPCLTCPIPRPFVMPAYCSAEVAQPQPEDGMSGVAIWIESLLSDRNGGWRRAHTPSGDTLESIHTNPKYWCIVAGMSRTNIEINDQLAREAQKLTGPKTKAEKQRGV